MATFGIQPRFKTTTKHSEDHQNITGNWEVNSSKNNPEDTYQEIGQFKHQGIKYLAHL